ncbi:MAG: beta-N-acetylhexosaminidase [Paeniclostridium sordellii]|nr:beta-N-acetylhexosaminidase [Paeniclostridium sordellii]
MSYIKGEKAYIINTIFGICMFLLIGIVRPVLVYFFNIDIINLLMIIMIILAILIIVGAKENKRKSINIFDRSVNMFILGSVFFIIKNESNIFTPILTIISCILIFILYKKKIKTKFIKNYISYFIIIFSIIIIFITIIQDYLDFSNLYKLDKGYKSCSIIKELQVPINAKKRNYKLNNDNIKVSIGYRIKGIDKSYKKTSLYIEKLKNDGWKVIDVKHFLNKVLYTLTKDEKRVIIEMKENSLIIGVVSDIKDKISKMSLEEKIGQMIIAGFNGKKLNEEINTLVNDLDVGGIILFSRNIENSNQLKKLTEDINNINKNIPLFISTDEEGGRVSRLPNDTTKFKSAKDIGDKGDTNYAYENGMNLGRTLKEHNINMDFAPAIDIYSNPKNTVIGDRAFGTDEKIVSAMGIATMNGLKREGVIPVVKHFPGHGDTDIDSHFDLPVVNKSLKQLENFELVPFKEAIDKGCDAIMVSHILVEKIDSKNPATLSKNIIYKLLREKMNFKGVVITDDMHMKAISNNLSIEEASVKSINAGSDIILIGSDIDITKSVIEKIKLAVKNNNITEDRIDESVYRILTLKEKYLNKKDK